MKNTAFSIIALFIILVATTIPTYAFVIPPNPSGEDNKYELYGPHVKGIVIKLYADTTTKWTEMDAGHLDFEDWLLERSWLDRWSTPAGPITEANYGGDAGFYILDINNNATYTPNDYTPGIRNPTSDVNLRRAIACCVNRSDIVSVSGGSVLPIYTPVPSYMTGCINEQIAPGQSLDNLTWGGYTGNLTLAAQILDANGFVINSSSGWRIDPTTGKELNLIFYTRGGIRLAVSDNLNRILNSPPIQIRTTYYNHFTRRSDVGGPVYSQGYFNLYMGGWTIIGPDPDYLFDLYHGSNYYHPGSPPNYDGINDPILNNNLTSIKTATTFESGIVATLAAQVRFATIAASVPLWSSSGVKAYRNVPVDGGGNWTQMVNEKGTGVSSWWSTLNIYKQGQLYPNFTYYGLSSDITLLNVVFAQWTWDFEVLSRIYDSGAARDPMTLATWIPQLFKSWQTNTWADPSTGGALKTKLTITLRPDVYWQDGQPLTIADVYYTLVEIGKDLLAKGFPPPWWYPTVEYMRSVEILDPYNIEILLNVNSIWAAGWVLGTVIIPKHIWKPIVDASSPAQPFVAGRQPDPNIIGTGPFRWYSGDGLISGSTVVLVANSPGSIVNGITSLGYYLYNPVYVDVNPDNCFSKITIGLTDSSTISNVTATLRNLWQGGNLTGSKYVYLNDMLQPAFPQSLTLQPVSPWDANNPYPVGASDLETMQFMFPKKTLNFVKVAFQITGPAALPDGEANPWLDTWVNTTLPIWTTIRQDITGTTLFDVLGFGSQPNSIKTEAPAPDLKVDGKDISLAAKAFGTVPGDPRWRSVADLNGDYKVDGKDIALIAKQFGY